MKVYLIGDSEAPDLDKIVDTLNIAGHLVSVASADCDLRMKIGMMIANDAVCLLDGWWSERDGICLQTLAAWLHMKLLDEHGQKIPTSGLAGLRG